MIFFRQVAYDSFIWSFALLQMKLSPLANGCAVKGEENIKQGYIHHNWV